MSAVVSAIKPILRPMLKSDLRGVMEVERAAYQFPWSVSIFRDCLRMGYHCYVYQALAGLAGHGIMSIGAAECHFLNICIHPDYQRSGLGRKLVDHLLEIARRKGVRVALLEVRISNTAAYRLYISLGFDEIGIRKNYYPARVGREDAIILAKEL